MDPELSRPHVIAYTAKLMEGRGEFAAAALFYRARRIVLKQGIFVIEDSRSSKPIEVLPVERYKAMRDGERFMGNNPIGRSKRVDRRIFGVVALAS